MEETIKGRILYYVQDEKKKIQLEVIGMSMSIETRSLKPSDLNTWVGELVGMKPFSPPDPAQAERAPAIFCMPEVIIFSGISNEKLDEVLRSYKNVGLEPIRLKAVTTPRNIYWTLYQLIRELSAERALMEGKVNRLIASGVKKEEEDRN